MRPNQNSELYPRWVEWCKGFLALPQTEMTPDATMDLLGLMMVEDTTTPDDVKNMFPVQVFNAHAARLGLHASAPTIVFLSAHAAKNVGALVMYAHALRYWQLTHGNPVINLTNLCYAFPFGFPDESQLSLAWDKQKDPECPAGNMLDAVS